MGQRLRIIALAGTLIMAACGPSGSVKIVDVGTPPDPNGTGATMGMVGVMVTFEVTGPVTNGVVMCQFTGQHTFDAGTATAKGWVTLTKIGDIPSGASTSGTCSANLDPAIRGPGAVIPRGLPHDHVRAQDCRRYLASRIRASLPLALTQPTAG